LYAWSILRSTSRVASICLPKSSNKRNPRAIRQLCRTRAISEKSDARTLGMGAKRTIQSRKASPGADSAIRRDCFSMVRFPRSIQALNSDSHRYLEDRSRQVIQRELETWRGAPPGPRGRRLSEFTARAIRRALATARFSIVVRALLFG
jgi:hypothetical protein